MYLMEHVFECSVIVVEVRRRDFVGEERRRVQELHVGLDCSLVEVVGLGLITCGEGGARQRRPHSRCRSCAGLPQTSCSSGRGKGPKVEQEVETEDQGEETAHTSNILLDTSLQHSFQSVIITS